MTLRIVPPSIAVPEVRPSARVSTIAEMLNDDPRQIRRMVARGDLEGHRQGKRGVRIYLDSVAAWQQGHPLAAKKSPGAAAQDPPKPRSRATQAAHSNAVAYLQGLGIVPASRR